MEHLLQEEEEEKKREEGETGSKKCVFWGVLFTHTHTLTHVRVGPNPGRGIVNILHN